MSEGAPETTKNTEYNNRNVGRDLTRSARSIEYKHVTARVLWVDGIILLLCVLNLPLIIVVFSGGGEGRIYDQSCTAPFLRRGFCRQTEGTEVSFFFSFATPVSFSFPRHEDESVCRDRLQRRTILSNAPTAAHARAYAALEFPRDADCKTSRRA